MKKLLLTSAIAALALSTTAFAGDNSGISGAVSSSSLGIQGQIGSSAASYGDAGAGVSGTATGHHGSAEASNTSFSTGASMSSTTLGYGETAGLGGAVGKDKTSLDDSSSQSAGLTGGHGDAGGITSTSVASHTDNAGSTGYAESNGQKGHHHDDNQNYPLNTATFNGGAYSQSKASAQHDLNVDYTTSSHTWTIVKGEHEDRKHK